MVRDDTAYYRQRVVTERAMATFANRKEVAAIHEELARHYEALADQDEARPPPNAETESNATLLS